MNMFEEALLQLDTIIHMDTTNQKAHKLYNAIKEKQKTYTKVHSEK
jgi:hypothetical protein